MIPILIRDANSGEVLWAGSYWCAPQIGSLIALAPLPSDDALQARSFAVMGMAHVFQEGDDTSVQRVDVRVIEVDSNGKPKTSSIIRPSTIH